MTDSIIFAGTPHNAADTLRALVAAGVEVEFVLTRTDSPFGRKRVLTPSPVAIAATELGLPVIKANSIDSLVLTHLNSSRSQMAIVVAFGVLLKSEAINSLTKGWFNLHYSLLPALRGAAPVQHALLKGLRETGVTVFKIDEGLDTGPVVATVPSSIEPTDNAGTLLRRLTELGTSLLLQEIPRLLSGVGILLKPQEGVISLAPKLSRQDAKISFETKASLQSNLIRATNPEPGAWCLIENETLKVLEARETESNRLAQGEVELIEGRVLCGFADGATLQLITVQPAGKTAMNATDWLRGRQGKVWLT